MPTVNVTIADVADPVVIRVDDMGIIAGRDGRDGAPGADGFSPTVEVEEIEGGAISGIGLEGDAGFMWLLPEGSGSSGDIVLEDESGTVYHIPAGSAQSGDIALTDGSGHTWHIPVDEVSNSGHKITVTDIDGEKTFYVWDGKDGKDGTPGIPGTDGAPGEDGRDGRDGEDGEDATAFVAEYDVTTQAELDAAYNAGRMLFCRLPSGLIGTLISVATISPVSAQSFNNYSFSALSGGIGITIGFESGVWTYTNRGFASSYDVDQIKSKIPAAASSVNKLMDAAAVDAKIAPYRTAAAQDVIDAGKEASGLGLTGASVGDLVRVNAVDATGKPTSWKKVHLNEIKCNHNYLENWDFTNPINQRGQQSYSTTGYSIDRWWRIFGVTTIVDSGISYFVGATEAYPGAFRQALSDPQKFAGRTVTISVLIDELVDGTIKIGCTKSLGMNSGMAAALAGKTVNKPGLVTITGTLPNDVGSDTYPLLMLSISISKGATVKIRAVKLELGSEQTLCHNEGTEENPVWVLNEIPDYGEELRKCQKYYVKYYSTAWRIIGSVQIDNNIQRCLVVLPASMVNNPKSIAVNGQMQFLGNPSITVTIPPTSCAIENTNLYMYYTQDSSAQTGLFPIRLNASTLEISCEP